MVRLTIQPLTVSLLLLAGMSCMGRYSIPQLVPVVKPDPAQDFARLREQVLGMGGDFVCSDDDLVSWKDTSMFRIFELKHHTVVVFPYNWGDPVYDIIIFSGRIKPGLDPYEALQFDFKSGSDAQCWNTGIEWNVSEPVVSQVHFQDLYLGDSEKRVVALQAAYIERTITDPQDRQNEIGVLTGWRGWLEAHRSDTHLGMACVNGKLVYIEISPIGRATLGGFAIENPKSPIIARGTFTIGNAKGNAKGDTPPY